MKPKSTLKAKHYIKVDLVVIQPTWIVLTIKPIRTAMKNKCKCRLFGYIQRSSKSLLIQVKI